MTYIVMRYPNPSKVTNHSTNSHTDAHETKEEDLIPDFPRFMLLRPWLFVFSDETGTLKFPLLHMQA